MEGTERGSRVPDSVTWVVLYSWAPRASLCWAVPICKSWARVKASSTRNTPTTRPHRRAQAAQHTNPPLVSLTCGPRQTTVPNRRLSLSLCSSRFVCHPRFRAHERIKSLFRSAGRRERAAGAGREGEALAPVPAADADGTTSRRRRRSSPRTASRARPGGLRRALRRPARLGVRVPPLRFCFFAWS